MERYVLTLRCDDQPGIIRSVTEGVSAIGGNIVESAQFSDLETSQFCLRMTIDTSLEPGETVRDTIATREAPLDPMISVRPVSKRRRVLIMVSKFDHCLNDLLYRWRTGELLVDIPAVVSNHEELRSEVEAHGIPFIHVPVTRDTKAAAEASILRLVADLDVDLVVLARYMQILSDDLCRALAGRCINIHHSFLPGFKGAKPYHQAHERGVKLIGATAHFVTGDLDEGPIIEQDVVRVGHQEPVEEFVRRGRDVERVVLSRAVRNFSEDRILLLGQRTVVFA